MADTSSFQLTNDDLEFVRTLVQTRASRGTQRDHGRDQHAQDDEYAYTQELTEVDDAEIRLTRAVRLTRSQATRRRSPCTPRPDPSVAQQIQMATRRRADRRRPDGTERRDTALPDHTATG